MTTAQEQFISDVISSTNGADVQAEERLLRSYDRALMLQVLEQHVVVVVTERFDVSERVVIVSCQILRRWMVEMQLVVKSDDAAYLIFVTQIQSVLWKGLRHCHHKRVICNVLCRLLACSMMVLVPAMKASGGTSLSSIYEPLESGDFSDQVLWAILQAIPTEAADLYGRLNENHQNHPQEAATSYATKLEFVSLALDEIKSQLLLPRILSVLQSIIHPNILQQQHQGFDNANRSRITQLVSCLQHWMECRLDESESSTSLLTMKDLQSHGGESGPDTLFRLLNALTSHISGQVCLHQRIAIPEEDDYRMIDDDDDDDETLKNLWYCTTLNQITNLWVEWIEDAAGVADMVVLTAISTLGRTALDTMEYFVGLERRTSARDDDAIPKLAAQWIRQPKPLSINQQQESPSPFCAIVGFSTRIPLVILEYHSFLYLSQHVAHFVPNIDDTSKNNWTVSSLVCALVFAISEGPLELAAIPAVDLIPYLPSHAQDCTTRFYEQQQQQQQQQQEAEWTAPSLGNHASRDSVAQSCLAHLTPLMPLLIQAMCRRCSLYVGGVGTNGLDSDGDDDKGGDHHESEHVRYFVRSATEAVVGMASLWPTTSCATTTTLSSSLWSFGVANLIVNELHRQVAAATSTDSHGVSSCFVLLVGMMETLQEAQENENDLQETTTTATLSWKEETMRRNAHALFFDVLQVAHPFFVQVPGAGFLLARWMGELGLWLQCPSLGSSGQAVSSSLEEDKASLLFGFFDAMERVLTIPPSFPAQARLREAYAQSLAKIASGTACSFRNKSISTCRYHRLPFLVDILARVARISTANNDNNVVLENVALAAAKYAAWSNVDDQSHFFLRCILPLLQQQQQQQATTTTTFAAETTRVALFHLLSRIVDGSSETPEGARAVLDVLGNCCIFQALQLPCVGEEAAAQGKLASSVICCAAFGATTFCPEKMSQVVQLGANVLEQSIQNCLTCGPELSARVAQDVERAMTACCRGRFAGQQQQQRHVMAMSAVLETQVRSLNAARLLAKQRQRQQKRREWDEKTRLQCHCCLSAVLAGAKSGWIAQTSWGCTMAVANSAHFFGSRDWQVEEGVATAKMALEVFRWILWACAAEEKEQNQPSEAAVRMAQDVGFVTKVLTTLCSGALGLTCNVLRENEGYPEEEEEEDLAARSLDNDMRHDDDNADDSGHDEEGHLEIRGQLQRTYMNCLYTVTHGDATVVPPIVAHAFCQPDIVRQAVTAALTTPPHGAFVQKRVSGKGHLLAMWLCQWCFWTRTTTRTRKPNHYEFRSVWMQTCRVLAGQVELDRLLAVAEG